MQQGRGSSASPPSCSERGQSPPDRSMGIPQLPHCLQARGEALGFLPPPFCFQSEWDLPVLQPPAPTGAFPPQLHFTPPSALPSEEGVFDFPEWSQCLAAALHQAANKENMALKGWVCGFSEPGCQPAGREVTATGAGAPLTLPAPALPSWSGTGAPSQPERIFAA